MLEDHQTYRRRRRPLAAAAALIVLVAASGGALAACGSPAGAQQSFLRLSPGSSWAAFADVFPDEWRQIRDRAWRARIGRTSRQVVDAVDGDIQSFVNANVRAIARAPDADVVRYVTERDRLAHMAQAESPEFCATLVGPRMPMSVDGLSAGLRRQADVAERAYFRAIAMGLRTPVSRPRPGPAEYQRVLGEMQAAGATADDLIAFRGGAPPQNARTMCRLIVIQSDAFLRLPPWLAAAASAD